MIDIDWLADRLVSAGLLSDVVVVEPQQLGEVWGIQHKVVQAIEGLTVHAGLDFMIRVGFTASFPYQLPVVFSLEKTHWGQIPHVFAHGYVCYREPEGLLLDPEDPVGVVSFALHEALQILAEGQSGTNQREFFEELTLHWPGPWSAFNLFEPSDELAKIGSFAISDEVRVVTHTQQEGVEALLSRVPLFRDATFGPVMRPFLAPVAAATWEDGIYIPLEEPRSVSALLREEAWTLQRVIKFIRGGLSKKRQGRLERMTRRTPQDSCFAVLSVPRDRGEPNLVGIRFTGVRGGHPLGRASSEASVAPFRLHRFDQRYLKARSGARDLGTAHVLLVGCGAIGGNVAMELARSGVGALTLVDPDVLTAENAFRHVLGMPSSFVQPSKASLLASTISQQYPGLSTRAEQASIEDVLRGGFIDPANYSLIISATGDHNVDRMLNESLFGGEQRGRILFTWLEPLGVGGHALLCAGERAPGCFECLFTPNPADVVPQLWNRAAFAAPGQVFTRELAGCGSAFTPYSSLDAMRTAELAVRLALRALTGEQVGPLLRSWKGDATEFRREGYRTSERFEVSSDELERGRTDFNAANCRVCGSSR